MQKPMGEKGQGLRGLRVLEAPALLGRTQPPFSGSLSLSILRLAVAGCHVSRFFVYFFACTRWCKTNSKMQKHCHRSIINHHQDNVHINTYRDSRLWHLVWFVHRACVVFCLHVAMTRQGNVILTTERRCVKDT